MERVGHGHALPDDGVHDERGVALQERHQALEATNHVTLVLGHQQGEPSQVPVVEPACPNLLQGVLQPVQQPARVELDAGEVALDGAGQVAPEPGDAAELQPMAGLVEREPQPEVALREREPPFDADDVRRDEVDQAVVVRRGEGVVLSEDAPAEVAEQGADLSSQDVAPDDARRTVSPVVEELVGERLHHPFEPSQVRAEPVSPSLHPWPRWVDAGLETGELPDDRLGLRNDLLEVLRQRRPVLGREDDAPGGDLAADRTGGAPVDQPVGGEGHRAILHEARIRGGSPGAGSALGLLAGGHDRRGSGASLGHSPVDALVELLLEHSVERLLVEFPAPVGGPGLLLRRLGSGRGGLGSGSGAAGLLGRLRGRPLFRRLGLGLPHRVGLDRWLAFGRGRRRRARCRGGRRGSGGGRAFGHRRRRGAPRGRPGSGCGWRGRRRGRRDLTGGLRLAREERWPRSGGDGAWRLLAAEELRRETEI